MYRRDISSTLRILAVLLGAFVFYHIWMQPPATLAPTPASLPSTNIDATPNFPPALVEPAPSLDVPRTRLIEFGDAPSATHQQIREHLDRGEYKLAESALRALGDNQRTAAREKAYVAALWNNLGVQQEKLGGIDVSVNAFKRAVSLAPRNPTALLNLTQAYWGLRHRALTPQFLETVIQIAPDDPFPHLALAELLIDKGRKAEALPHLKRAKARIHHDSNLTALLEKLEAKTAQASAPPLQAKARAPKSKPAEQAPLPKHSSSTTDAASHAPAETIESTPTVESTPPVETPSERTTTVPAPTEVAP
ncbi:MAG: tetratricopeptide repeat protein [Nitrospira sp.]